jgi:hypothetical protein
LGAYPKKGTGTANTRSQSPFSDMLLGMKIWRNGAAARRFDTLVDGDLSRSEKGYRHREYAEPVPFFGSMEATGGQP